MTRDDVLRLAREAGAGVAMIMSAPPRIASAEFRGGALERFAALVAAEKDARIEELERQIASAVAAEREACALIVSQGHWKHAVRSVLAERAAAIRARGKK